jgi:LacI family transcriptional regulator
LPPRATGKITSRDIAAEAGVSQSTVSRVLRRDPRVHPAKVARVRAAAERHGYAPSAAARALITQRSNAVAVVVDDLTNPFYPELVERLRTALERRGYMSTLLNEATDAGSDTLAALLAGGGADGAILLSATTSAATRGLLADAALPTVLLNRDVPSVRADRVLVDNAGGARAVAEHLIGLGHRRIAMVAGPAATTTSAERERAFTAVVGVVAVPRAGGDAYAAGRSIGIELLGAKRRATAIFCANDILAFGVLGAARERGLDVPGELSVAGFDDVAMAAWAAFDLTTVRQPLGAMADAAADLLAHRVESPAARSRRNVHATELVVRGSTGRVRGRG